MFQSRNRESYLFKLGAIIVMLKALRSFQSRNRESYLFKSRTQLAADTHIILFQSRNRESYLFKHKVGSVLFAAFISFNLVIENLIFSRLGRWMVSVRCNRRFQSRNRESYLFKLAGLPAYLNDLRLMFQSRNRESYLFKYRKRCCQQHHRRRFNLVIENLIFSRRSWAVTRSLPYSGFNLVIENLIFSRSIRYPILTPNLKVSIS